MQPSSNAHQFELVQALEAAFDCADRRLRQTGKLLAVPGNTKKKPNESVADK